MISTKPSCAGSNIYRVFLEIMVILISLSFYLLYPIVNSILIDYPYCNAFMLLRNFQKYFERIICLSW